MIKTLWGGSEEQVYSPRAEVKRAFCVWQVTKNLWRSVWGRGMQTGRKGESVRSLTLTDLHLSVPGNFMDPPQKWCNSTHVWMERILSALAEEPCGKARSAAEVFSPLFWSQTEEEFWIIFASTHLSRPTPTPAGNPCLRYNEVPPLLSAESCRILSCPYCSMQW